MKIYLVEKSSSKRLINLGGKITLERLNNELNRGNTIFIQDISGELQTEYRLRKVAQTLKKDRGAYKSIKAFYVLNLQLSKTGSENFLPRQISNEQNFRFHSLERAINMLESKSKLNRADWLIEKK